MPKKEQKKKKNDRMWMAIVALLLILIAGVLYLDYSKKKSAESLYPTPPSQFSTSEPVPPLHPITTDSEIQSSLDSGKPVVLYFYSSTCGSCVQAKDNVLALEERLKAYNVRLIAVESANNQAMFEKFGASLGNLIAWQGREVMREPFNANSNLDEIMGLILKALGIG